jgi:hypothetical protein
MSHRLHGRIQMRHPANPPKAGFFLCDAPRTGKTLVALTSLLDIGNELASGLSPTLILCSAGHTWKVSDGRRTKILGHSLYLTRSFQDELCLHLPQLKQ